MNLSESKWLTNLQKKQLQENFFSSVYVIGVTCFDECFFYKTLFFLKKIFITVRLFQPTYCCFLLTSVFKEVPILWYLHNNSAVLILMFKLISKIKLSYYTYTCLKNFRSWLFSENTFYTFYFLTFPHFFL